MTQCSEIIKIKLDEQRDSESFDALCVFLKSKGLVPHVSDESDLIFSGKRLYLLKDEKKISFDWQQQYLRHLKKNYVLKKEPLAKALGLKSGEKKSVIDATMGTGKDLILLLAFGQKVIAFERNPSVFALCASSYLEFIKNSGEVSLDIFYGEARSFPDIIGESDAIYFDPMYPEKKKSSLSRKEMEAFKDLVGPDSDIDNVLSDLIKLNKWIVLKRPIKAKKLEYYHQSFTGKTTRYDRIMP